jgi:hypothetical protein
MKNLIPFNLFEGKTMKASRENDSEVKIQMLRDKVENIAKSKGATLKTVGDDYEVHVDGEHVAQVMFRKDLVTVKKVGAKFGKEFKYTEFGKIKAELSVLLK